MLGGVRLGSLTTEEQNNTNLLNGIYIVDGNVSSTTQGDWGLLYNIHYNERLGMQLKLCVNKKTLNFRARDTQMTGTWTEWKEL